MGTYPVILYPKLIADFRQRYCYSPNSQNDFARNLSNLSQSFGAKSKSVAVVNNQSRYLSKKQVFVLRLLGTGLVIIGISYFRTSVGLLAFGVGTLALLIPLLQKLFVSWRGGNRLTKEQQKSSSQELSIPVSQIESLSAQTVRKGNDLKSNLKVYLSHLADTMRGKVLQPDGVTDAPIGASEKAFGLVLEKFFQGRVKAQLRLPIPNWDGAYSTDFTISFPEIGIWIDCEIDEPYDYKTGKPTHCTDDERDRNRNKFFLSHNWIVVRFSEEQVVLYPESCCKELVLVIKRVTGMEMFSKGLATVPTLKPAPMWTGRQAKKMAKVKYRDKYLLTKEKINVDNNSKQIS